jgi:hypothetical protein
MIQGDRTLILSLSSLTLKRSWLWQSDLGSTCCAVFHHKLEKLSKSYQRGNNPQRPTPFNTTIDSAGKIDTERKLVDSVGYRRMGTPSRAGGGLTLGSFPSLAESSAPSESSTLVPRCR